VSAVRRRGTPARSASAESSAGPSRPIVIITHGNRAEQPARGDARRRIHLLEEPISLAENQDTAGAEIFVKARQREAGLLMYGSVMRRSRPDAPASRSSSRPAPPPRVPRSAPTLTPVTSGSRQ
jgi:hypothetical protein